jgi:hypothetical protein
MKKAVAAPVRARRSGAVLLLSLIAILIVTAVSLSLTQTFLLQSRHTVLRLEKDQADLLALAGLEHVAILLRKHPDQSEFHWDVQLSDQRQQGHLRAQIVSTGPRERRIVVTAVITNGGSQSTQTTLIRSLAGTTGST